MYGIVVLFPDLWFGDVHSLLHVAARLECRCPVIRHLGEEALEVAAERCAAPFRHHFHELGVGLVASTEEGYHFQPVEGRFRVT